jgi:Raf kinase inhibitor-like YbhB/YbcL family protein
MRTPTRVVFAVTCAVVLGTVLVGCAGETEKEGAMELMIRSTAFDHGGAIPRRYTCEGDDVSPPLAWSELPDGAKSLVLIVDDPDAPDPAKPRMTWVHWVLYDIPATAAGLDEDVAPAALPAGTREGVNDWKRTGYGGPCPPIGRHRYFHKLYALDTELGDLGNATKAEVERAMKGHVLAEGVLMGTYQKGD